MSMVCRCDMCKEEATPNKEFERFKLIIYTPDRTNAFESDFIHLCKECLAAAVESMGELAKLVGGEGMKKEDRA